jgi:hypothetical protein
MTNELQSRSSVTFFLLSTHSLVVVVVTCSFPISRCCIEPTIIHPHRSIIYDLPSLLFCCLFVSVFPPSTRQLTTPESDSLPIVCSEPLLIHTRVLHVLFSFAPLSPTDPTDHKLRALLCSLSCSFISLSLSLVLLGPSLRCEPLVPEFDLSYSPIQSIDRVV